MLLLLAHAAATWYMVGLIWFVQLVHYPLFGAVGERGFAAYATEHQRRTSWVVGPPMLAEAASAAWLVAAPPAGLERAPFVVGLALLAVVWLSTALAQVPRHTVLGRGYDARAHQTLVAGNWLRTVAWSARGALVLWLAARLVA
jgi:hypothetical protein